MQHLHGKVAVVTGAASGIGRAVATEFASRGMFVVAADIDVVGLDAVVHALRTRGGHATAVPTDVSDPVSIQRLADRAVEQYGTVHVLHNNAGVVAAGPIEDLALETWEWVLKVDLWSVIYGIRSFLPIIESNEEGHIISTASSAGLQASSGIGPYNVAKFGVIALMETLAAELEQRDSPIGTSVLCPGAVNTSIATSRDKMPDAVRDAHHVTAVDEKFVASAGSLLSERGMEPAVVATAVADAVVNNRFWIITHSGWLDVLQNRLDGMRAGELRRGFGG